MRLVVMPVLGGILRFAFLSSLAALVLVGAAPSARGQNCNSMDPADWPQPAKPYFMLLVDTSGSMAACTNPSTAWPTSCPSGATLNSCGFIPYRANDAKCALSNTVLAFAGQVNFGMATFSRTISGCPAACNLGMSGSYAYLYNGCTFGGSGCTGARIVVPLLVDTQPPPASNLGDLMSYYDNTCNDNREIFAYDGTPLGASLDNLRTYFQSSFGGFTSPLTVNDPACRSLNVILLTDGGETCSGNPTAAAQSLYNGFTKDGIFRRIYTHVIAFNVDSVADQTTLNNIHKMGQCGATTGACADAAWPYLANNEVTLAQSLAAIIAGAIPPETCDNQDNNCNGCVDEGFAKYCNQGQPCCTWSTSAQRTACLTSYQASIATNPPNGDLELLPCTTTAQQQDPNTWLCYNPGETCDGIDNNCNSQIDEDLPLNNCGYCGPAPEEIPCNGIDDDCDPSTPDEPPGCTCGVEYCNGLDDDCDGLIDDDDPDMPNNVVPCGPSPALGICQQGTLRCNYGDPICEGAVYPRDEVCNGLDDNCNGIVDDVVYDPAECLIPDCTTECCDGRWACVDGVDVCVPNAISAQEICDGLDNDCDGRIDEGAICEGALVCWYGTCAFRVPPDGCGEGYVSVDGLCVEEPCLGSLCDGGLVCEPDSGQCVDPCEDFDCSGIPGTMCDATLATCDAEGGCTVDESACVIPDCLLDPTLCEPDEVCKEGACVTDPCFGPAALDCAERACRDGACVDTCVGVTCEAGSACVDGSCEAKPCGEFVCPPGQSCVTGQCAQNPCGGVICRTGEVCQDGECVDDPCRLVVCPDGAWCEKGQCVGGGGSDGGVVFPDAGPEVDAATELDAAVVWDDGGAPEDFRLTVGGGGCTCQARGMEGSAGGLCLLFGVLLLGWIRQRR